MSAMRLSIVLVVAMMLAGCESGLTARYCLAKCNDKDVECIKACASIYNGCKL